MRGWYSEDIKRAARAALFFGCGEEFIRKVKMCLKIYFQKWVFLIDFLRFVCYNVKDNGWADKL